MLAKQAKRGATFIIVKSAISFIFQRILFVLFIIAKCYAGDYCRLFALRLFW